MRRSAALAVLGVTLLCGCGVKDPYGPVQGGKPPVPNTAGVPVAATAAAADYARLAQTWTPDTLADQYDGQLRASAGQLHQDLVSVGAPTADEIRALRDDRQSATADVLGVNARVARPGVVRARVRLRQISTATDSVQETAAVYVVTVEHRGATWLVTRSTADPSGGS